MKLAALFKGKESAKEEKSEKKMSPAQYARGEAMEKKMKGMEKGGRSQKFNKSVNAPKKDMMRKGAGRGR
jgi:hypothetical protein